MIEKAKNCKTCQKLKMLRIEKERKARIDENAKLLRGDDQKLQSELLRTSDNEAIKTYEKEL